MEENKASYEQLEQENRQLKEQLENIESSKKFQKKAAKWTFRKGVGVFLGKGLKDAIKQTLTEFNTEKKVSTETISDLGAHIIWRITRIGIFAIIIAILPTLFLIIQTIYLGKQNDKIDKQNELITNQNARLEQQTYLQEAGRRSSLVFLSNNVFDKMDEELKNPKNTNRELSDQLIGRIVSLSKSLKPYKYLENDSLSMTVSPERGQLLISLAKSKLGRRSYEKIFESSDFSFSEIKNITLEGTNFGNINLSNSILEDVVFLNCEFNSPNFSEALISDLQFENGVSYDIDFTESIINGLSFNNFIAKLLKIDLVFGQGFRFKKSFVFYLSFYQSHINDVYFNKTYVDNFQFILNDGKLIAYFKHLHKERSKSWYFDYVSSSFYNHTYNFGNIESFFSESNITEYTIKNSTNFFAYNFKKISINSKKDTVAFNSYFIDKNINSVKNKLQIVYTDPKASGTSLLKELDSIYENSPEIFIKKRKIELMNLLEKRGLVKKEIISDNYEWPARPIIRYRTFKKSKYYISVN